MKSTAYLFSVILLPLIFTGCLRKFDNYGVTDAIISNANNTSVTVLVAENNGTNYQENGGFVKTSYSVTYWLKQYETATGKLIKKKKVFLPSEANLKNIACYGRHGNNIWMFIEGLTAFDINTLEEVTNEKKIAMANGVSKTIFPLDDRLIRPNIEKGYINFVSDNGEAYYLALTDLKITQKGNEHREDKQTRSIFHEDDYGNRCDTLQHAIYAFAKNETAAKECSPNRHENAEVAYRMKFFKGIYSIHKLGDHNSISIENIQQASGDTYLNPCFASDTYKNNIIHLSGPDGFIIIHQDVLGEKSKAIFTRMDTEGKVIWEKKSGVSTKIETCTLLGKYLFITTNKDYMFSSFIGKDALCIINIEDGTVIMPSLKD